MASLLESPDGLSYGIVQPGKNQPSGVPIVRVTDLRGDGIDVSNPLRVDPPIDQQHRRTRLRGGEVLLSVVGTVGRVAIAPPRVAGWNVARAVAVLRPKDPGMAPWLRYVLQSPEVQRAMGVAKTDTVQATLNLRDIASLMVPLPEAKARSEIAGLLGAFDDLVERNSALTSSHVDFALALFEATFVGRDLGTPLGQIARVVDCLHSKKPERAEGGPGFLLQLSNIRGDGLLDAADQYRISAVDYARWSAKFETEPWDCVITNVGRVGASARIPSGVIAALGRNMTGLRPHSPTRDGAFLAVSLRSGQVLNEIRLKTDMGSIMDALNVRSIPHLLVPSAEAHERQKFQDEAGPHLQFADELVKENEELRRTREELLPLLMSGRIRPGEVA
jgi:type I restriction enzyme S subunit